jgi:hypothetical protein
MAVVGQAPANPYVAPIAKQDPDTGSGASSSRAYQPLFALALILTVVLAFQALVEVVAAVQALMIISVMSPLEAGEQQRLTSLLEIDDRAAMIRVLQAISGLGSAVLFCVLTHRANRNARSFGQVPMAFSPGWAVGFYFIPVVALWQPYLAMKEIWSASEPPGDRSRKLPRLLEIPWLLLGWWAAFIVYVGGHISMLVLHREVLFVLESTEPSFGPDPPGQIVLHFAVRPDGASSVIRSAYAELFSAAATLVAVALAITLVRSLARRQAHCQRALASGDPPAV